MKTTSLSLSVLAASALVLAGCQTSSTPDDGVQPATPEETAVVEAGPSVVATTTILGSVVRDILMCAVGNDAGLTVLFPIGADPHDFQPSSAQVASMSAADLVVVNGLFLEEGLVAAVAALVEEGAPVLEVAELVDPLAYGEEDDGHDHDHGHDDDHAEDKDAHDHGDFDPHFWMDMSRMATVAELVGTELAAHGDEFVECGRSVAEDIRQAEVGVVEILSVIPEANRVVVTDHDALGYFAERYGFRVVGVVIPGGSTLAEPNSQELAALVRVIRDQSVRAIFANTATSSNVSRVLADEVGQNVSVVNIYVGSLGGPGTGAETYIDMMTTNASLMAASLTD
jgi:zinc/manganese transport system substrate-binding protein